MNLSSESRGFYNYVGLDMQFRWNRLYTLQAIKTDFVKKEDLADDGLFYFGQGDLVECYKCGVNIGKWAEGDIPREEHKNFSPDCSIVKDEVKEEPMIHKKLHPDNQGMARNENRLQTYSIWPSILDHLVDSLVEAGLYYLGTGDETKCFFCSGIIDSWQKTDIPWERHADKYPYCEYVRVMKGLRYIVNLKFKKNFDPEMDDEPVKLPVIRRYTEPKYKSKCVLCLEKKRDVIFDKCGHIAACQDCESSKLITKICPMCDMPYDIAWKFFHS